jgi:NADPH:quinone reductase-like Zn-dependent oxidoreductase
MVEHQSNSLPQQMMALVLKGHGSLEQVKNEIVPLPVIGRNEVLIKVKSAALNRLDLWVIEGWPGLKLTYPHILGSDCAGDVTAVGSEVEGFAPGDRVVVNPTLSCGHCSFCKEGRDNLCLSMAVLGEHKSGVYAEYAAVPARNLFALPEAVTYETAAAAALVFVTAWHSLISRGRLRAGESILIVGAAGGVNSASIQVAKLAGANPIYVVGSAPEKLQLARDLGADVVIDRHEENWSRAIYKATNRLGVDVVVDNVGADTFPDSLKALKRGGRLLTVGNSSGPQIALDNRYLFGKHLSIIGSTMGPVSDFETVMRLVFDGHLNAVIDTVYSLKDGLAALRRLADGDVAGKLILKP